MFIVYIALGIFMLFCAVLLVAYICFRRIFWAKRPKKVTEEYPTPNGEIYGEFNDEMVGFIKTVNDMPCRECEVHSFDGLALRGRYYEYAPDAPIELLLHGYRGSSVQDLSGGVLRCHKLGHSALIVDHRASGRSEGNIITMGAYESRDVLKWVEFIISDIKSDAKIIISGISMGASTAMIAAGSELPKNVVGVLADCGYTSAEAIIKKCVGEMNMSPKLISPFLKIAARVFAGFDLEDASSINAMKSAKVPVLFIHGDTDTFVPHSMSVENYEACTTKKKLVTVKDAGHGLCYMKDKEGYINEVRDFFDPFLKN